MPSLIPSLPSPLSLRPARIWLADRAPRRSEGKPPIECFEAVLAKYLRHLDASAIARALYRERSRWEPLSKVYVRHRGAGAVTSRRPAAPRLFRAWALGRTKGVGQRDDASRHISAILQLAPHEPSGAFFGPRAHRARERRRPVCYTHVSTPNRHDIAEESRGQGSPLHSALRSAERSSDLRRALELARGDPSDPRSLSAHAASTRLGRSPRVTRPCWEES